MSSEQQRLHEAQLQKEIEELRGDLGETVEALVHKADLPARAKERGNELKKEAVERGNELKEQTVERGIELHQQVVDRGTDLLERGNKLGSDVFQRGNELKGQALARSSELRDQAVEAADRARAAVSQTPKEQWVKLACAGLALIAVIVMARRVRTS